MKIGKEMFLEAALCCKRVYTENIDLGTTEFNIFNSKMLDVDFQILAMAGTNESMDWIKNINLTSIKGTKAPAYKAAEEIALSNQFSDMRDSSLPLIVTGHSKGGATAIAFQKIYGRFPFVSPNHCIAFAPARSLRYWINRKMKNTTIFTDPDDPVSFLGRISFGHPKCEHIKGENNHFGFKISDHPIDNWIRFTNNM